MELYTNNIQDRYGNAIVGAQVLVQKDGGSAVIYSDDGVTQAPNPLTTDADGEFRFYAPSGKYDLTVTSPRLPEPIEFPGVALFDPDDINAELRDQLASTEANYGASMVGVETGGPFTATTVQGVLEELDDDILNLAAAAISFTPTGGISSTDVQAAIEELEDDFIALGGDVLTNSDLGVTVQAYDADTAKLDVDQTWTGAQRGSITTDNDLSFDLNATNNFSCTPTAGGALTFTNIASASGQTGIIKLVNGSNYAITAAANTKVGSSTLATISATGTYILGYFCDGTNVYVTNSEALA